MVYGRGWRHAPFREYIDPENPSLIAALPPCFLVTARGDFLRHYSRDFAAALTKNGLEAELLDMDAPERLAHAVAAMLPDTAASFGLFFINGRYPTKAASLAKAPLCKGSCQNDFKNHFD